MMANTEIMMQENEIVYILTRSHDRFLLIDDEV